MNSKRIDGIQQYGKTAKGKLELIKHLEGDSLSRKQAIHAHCYDCMGFFSDGRHDCMMPKCSLHPFMVYNRNKQKGNSKVLSETHKARLQEGRKRAAGV
jgi:hypothetical protein